MLHTMGAHTHPELLLSRLPGDDLHSYRIFRRHYKPTQDARFYASGTTTITAPVGSIVMLPMFQERVEVSDTDEIFDDGHIYAMEDVAYYRVDDVSLLKIEEPALHGVDEETQREDLRLLNETFKRSQSLRITQSVNERWEDQLRLDA